MSEVVLVRAAKVSNAIESEAAIAVDVIYAFRTSPVRTVSIRLPNQSPKEVWNISKKANFQKAKANTDNN